MDKSRQLLKNHWALAAIVLLAPLLLCAVMPILPTHDDWAGTTTPDFKPFFVREHFLFYGYHWRPFDTWIGYVAGRNPQLLYPGFNHVLVVIGHTLNALIVFRLTRTLGYSRTASNVAALAFFLSPATMATVLAIDSQNQTYALLWGMLAFLSYVRLGKSKYVVWPLLVFMATLSKENGLMWALISPILAYGFDFTDRRTLRRDVLAGVAIMAFYALAIALLPRDITIHPEYVPDQFKVVKNVAKFLLTTFVTTDYVYLLHAPSRRLSVAAVTLLAALPFMYYVYVSRPRRFLGKRMVCTLASLVIAVGPHLLTVFSMMHTYAALAMVAILTASAVDCHSDQRRRLLAAFAAFLCVSVAIDGHLCHESVKSGQTGRKMAREAVSKTHEPARSVFLVIIEDDYPKLSSFCVVPCEAFGWGIAAKYETNYQWPEAISDTTIARTADAPQQAGSLARQELLAGSYDCAWIVDHQHVTVVNKNQQTDSSQ